MGSINSAGVYVYDETDQVSPLHTLLNLGMDSVSESLDLITAHSLIMPVASQAERDAYQQRMIDAGMPPSVTNVLRVDRTDLDRVERNDGTGWAVEGIKFQRFHAEWTLPRYTVRTGGTLTNVAAVQIGEPLAYPNADNGSHSVALYTSGIYAVSARVRWTGRPSPATRAFAEVALKYSGATGNVGGGPRQVMSGEDAGGISWVGHLKAGTEIEPHSYQETDKTFNHYWDIDIVKLG